MGGSNQHGQPPCCTQQNYWYCKGVSVVETLMYNSQHTAKSCEYMNFSDSKNYSKLLKNSKCKNTVIGEKKSNFHNYT